MIYIWLQIFLFFVIVQFSYFFSFPYNTALRTSRAGRTTVFWKCTPLSVFFNNCLTLSLHLLPLLSSPFLLLLPPSFFIFLFLYFCILSLSLSLFLFHLFFFFLSLSLFFFLSFFFCPSFSLLFFYFIFLLLFLLFLYLLLFLFFCLLSFFPFLFLSMLNLISFVLVQQLW